MNYHDRLFRTVANSQGGDVGHETTFHYRHAGDTVWATYEGGKVAFGTLLARTDADGQLDMRYQHVTADGVFKSGRCRSTPHTLSDGRLRLDESWTWTEGGMGSGQSQVEEVDPTRPVPEVTSVRDRTTAEHYTWGALCEGWRLLDQPGLTVIQERMPPGSAEQRHVHAHARQLFFVLGGELQIEQDLTVHRLHAGQALEMPPNTPHRVRNASSADVSFLVVSAPSTRRDRTNLE